MNKIGFVFILLLGTAAVAESNSRARIDNIVLVHGAWADGSGWRGVTRVLERRGFTVSIVQNPLTSLADDAAATARVLARQSGPCVLVGHSYGGAVVTAAGNEASVAALVYVAAFIPDVGESVLQLALHGPPLPLQFSADGFVFFDPALFRARFAADLSEKEAAFLATSQVPVSIGAFLAPLSQAAWKSKPSWAIVAVDDEAIGAAAERQMAIRAGARVVEMSGSHAVYISRPEAVADVIERAAQGD